VLPKLRFDNSSAHSAERGRRGRGAGVESLPHRFSGALARLGLESDPRVDRAWAERGAGPPAKPARVARPARREWLRL